MLALAPPPPLMRHQAEGVEFLLERRSGLLAFEQGLGKTRVAAEAFSRLLARGAVGIMVVICPNSLKRNWVVELQRFAPGLESIVIEGPARRRRQLLAATDADVVIINYEAARTEILAIRALMIRRRAVLVLDESHYIKNYRTLNSVAARHLAPLTPYRWLLSGTPITNTATDIYPQLCVVSGSPSLGSFAAFEATYGGRFPRPEQRSALAAAVAPHMLRRRKEECLDLPDKTFIDVEVILPRWQQELYDDMREGLVCRVKGMSQEEFVCYAPTAFTQLLRLSQLASNPQLIFPSETRTPGKLNQLDRLLQEIVERNDRKVILWSYYVGSIEVLVRRYAHLGAVALFGGTPPETRQDVARRFQEEAAVRLLVANPAAAGTGFTLTAANYTIYETLTWRYDLYAQSQDRNHRIGQHNPVTYLRLIAEGTIEHAIVEALARKANLAGELIGDHVAAALVSQMTPESFCRMLTTGQLPAEVHTSKEGLRDALSTNHSD